VGIEEFLLLPNMSTKLPSCLRFCLQTMYDCNLICEESILAWAKLRECEDSDPDRNHLFKDPKVQEFLEWLASNSEDEDDSEDADSDEDSDE
jgi:hypothetical protein